MDKLVDAIFEPEKVIEKEITKLKEDFELLIKPELERLRKVEKERDMLLKKCQAYKECCNMVIPNQVYTHKERRNTTVKFLDGSQQTVTLKKDEKDCIETAIAHCIMKQILTSKDVRELIEKKEVH